MAPKKKQQQNKPSSSKSKSKSQTSAGPKLQISAENENRLRRLLLNSGRSGPASSPAPADDTLSKAQKAKKLRSVYEKLSCEGFSNDHIELALSALKEGATFESALDWLCFNLSSNELPLKFSSGTSLHANEGGSIGIISTAREDWTPSVYSSGNIEDDEASGISIRIKGRRDDDSVDSRQRSQADWIRQYVAQQEEDESKTWEDDAVDDYSTKKVAEPRSYETIAKEYHASRLEALSAKEKGDKKGQEQAGHIIRKLKQELSALGLSDNSLESGFRYEHASGFASEDMSYNSMPEKHPEAITLCEVEGGSVMHPSESTFDGSIKECFSSTELSMNSVSSSVPLEERIAEQEDSGDVELSNFFEDAPSSEVLPHEVLKLQTKEKMKELSSGKNLEKLEGIWKKGDPQKIPKAVLHQLCQRSGWEAPKFNKVLGKENGFCYAVSVLRKSTGRGKSRKAGGLTTLELPDQLEAFESAEDAQNAVAAYALYQLFPDLPIHLAITEPYASFVIQWKEGESSIRIEDSEEDRRSGFVNSILDAGYSGSTAFVDVTDNSLPKKFQMPQIEENRNLNAAGPDLKPGRVGNFKEAESSYLKQEYENKMKIGKYKDMLKTRSGLPIAELKSEILQVLKEKSVLVVCGETGSGKTTQVPQFILDDMIEAGNGGYCNIICTQPRRIAAISVAERVADERCEPSPGSDGSVVGYQVRLDSASNVRTKLLFCTTGILLRKLAGDKNLSGITHVIVDEVHERSLLGDFLLIVLKNLIEKQSTDSTPKLKVILMSATVDSNLFSRYFGGCPVITAVGRTHPVSTYFLEDIYESIDYRLASDSPASIRYETSIKQKTSAVNNRRGKRNLVLSAWGDDSVLSEECINPYYVPNAYQSYSEKTQQNLKRLNEDVIDYDLLEDLVCYVDETYPAGAILVFLPGVAEIYMLLDKLAASYRFRGLSSDWLLPLHSSIASDDQRKVFLQPPENIRKVIIATNIAETSITIDDVVYVIDCGKHKENRYNPQKKLSSMVEDWISQANAKQRRGRAGRVKPGICFSLYTHYRFEKLLRPFQVPEMLRMPLVELCLQIKLLSLGNIKPFLSKALEPPTEEAMTSAISVLYEVGAIEGDEELTPLGHYLAKLPVDVLIGKMMLYGAIFGCLSPILSISAFLSYKSPFLSPKDERQNVERAKLALLTDQVDGASDSNDGARQSDHLVMMVAYKKWERILHEKGAKAAQHFCNSYFLSSSVMHMIRDMRVQFGNLLADIGLISLPKKYQIERKKKENLNSWFSDISQPFNTYSHHFSIVKAILCAGLYPNVAATEQGIAGVALGNIIQSSGSATKGRPVWYDGRREVHIHPSSINGNLNAFQYPFLVFLEKVETNKVFLRDTTIISPYSILLFGGSINVQHQSGMVNIDGWLKLAAPAQIAVLFKELRVTLHSVLKELIRKPEVFGSQSPFGPLHGIRWFLLARHSWIHSCSFLNLADKVAEPEKLPVDSTTAAGTVETKVKRKKLKGKRAVVRWLKFFRWKKKKEYERMTAEEKILYKLRKARRKEERLAEALTKIEPKESSETTHDPEILTPEEHFFFLKMGLKCKNYVPIGRRGIYQGVILNMHLHWKKHQTLQVVVKTFSPEEVKEIAVELARLTGGIVLDIHEENTIIMYRGKNYSQPPTEIMSPRITLSRKKALDKSKYRDGLRAVRKYIPRLEGDLELLQAQAKMQAENKTEAVEDFQNLNIDSINSQGISNLQPENSDKLRELLAGNNESSEEESLTDSGTESCSEALSDIFESDSDTDTKEKADQLLYLNEFEKFPVESDGEPEDFEEHLRQISADSRKAKSLEKDADLPQLDEVDQMFLRAASLLKKKRR